MAKRKRAYKRRGATNLLRQYADFCTHCRHKSFSTAPKGQMYCAVHDEFLDLEKLKKSRVFCDKHNK